MEGNEFRIEGVQKGESADAAIHERILKNREAQTLSDLAAVNAGLSLGLTVAQATKHFAGDAAFRELAEQGFLKD